jgi:hypothetical protein
MLNLPVQVGAALIRAAVENKTFLFAGGGKIRSASVG